MQGINDNLSNQRRYTPRYCLPCRVIVALSAIISVGLYIADDPLQEVVTLSVAGALLLYTLITCFINRDSAVNAILIALLDGIFVGLVASSLDYYLWPSLVLLSVSYFDAFARGGLKHWLLLNAGVAIGLASSYFLLQHQVWVIEHDYIIGLPIAIGAIVYFCIHGLSQHTYTLEVDNDYQQVADQLKAQKLRIYEISRYLPKPIWERIEGKKRAKIERKPITVFFSDIVGFSGLSEELEAETLSAVLSSYLDEMSKIVGQHNGTIDKFIGDAIMVTFGDDPSLSQGVKQDAIACVSMAIAMGKRMRELQPIWAEMGIKKNLQIRIGINSGYCTVGTFGTSQHMDHTALGVHVNLASRLESAGQPEEILVSHETWNLIKDTILCKDKGKIKAKGFTHPVQVFQVINHRRELGSNQSYFSETTEGFSMHLDMQKVKNYDREKVISSLEMAAKKLKKQFSETK